MDTVDLTDLQVLDLQVEALFTHDTVGRIVTSNEPGGGPAPHFFLGRTRMANRWRVRHDVPEATAQRLHTLAAAEPVRADLPREPHNLAAYLGALRADDEISSVVSGPAYRFSDPLPALTARVPPAVRTGGRAGVTRITRTNLHLLQRFEQMGVGWDLEILAEEFEGWEPMVAFLEDEAAVALCFSARLTPRAAEAGVETLEPYRGRGYAPIVVAAWAQTIYMTGRLPLYGTSWDNTASQAVARKLGLLQYGADLSLR
jgi:hypothetical protein